MLDERDIQKLIEVFTTKEDIKDLKQDINGLREAVQSLVVSVDKLVKAIDDLKTEYINNCSTCTPREMDQTIG